MGRNNEKRERVLYFLKTKPPASYVRREPGAGYGLSPDGGQPSSSIFISYLNTAVLREPSPASAFR
jgi:hypothetical protein